jgi:outer membrane protein assembly factor BamB
MTGRTQLVELVEDDDSRSARRTGRWSGTDAEAHRDEGSPVTPDAPGPEPGDRARVWVRRHWRWLVPSVAVVVAALVVTQGAVDAQERARLARLAAVPGVLAPVDRDLSVLWRADARTGTAVQQGTEIGDRVVAVLEDADDDSLGVVAIDVRTGRQAWRTPVERPARLPGPADQAQQLYAFCSSARHGDGLVAVCGATQQAQIVTQQPPTSLWVLDPADGTVLARRTVPGAAAYTIAGPDLVVATSVAGTGADRSWRVVASDAVTGAQHWTFTTPATRITSPYPQSTAPPDEAWAVPGLGATADGGVLVTSDRHVWELSSSGRVERSLDLPQYSWVDSIRGGLLFSSVYGATSSSHAGTIVLRDGTTVPTDDVSGYLTADDGSVPEMTFTVAAGDTGLAGITGRLVATGAPVWTHAGAIQSGLLLGGRLYLAQADGVVALDARTGEVLWRLETDYSVRQVGTDGNALLVPGPTARLTALSLGSGQRLWTRDLGPDVAGPGNPAWTVQQLEVDGRFREVVGWNDDGSIVFLG